MNNNLAKTAWTDPTRRPVEPLTVEVDGKTHVIQPNHIYYLSLAWIDPDARPPAYEAMAGGLIPCDVYLCVMDKVQP